MKSRKNDPSLAKIIVVLVGVILIFAGGFKVVQWLGTGSGAAKVEASAPATIDNARKLVEEGNAAQARELLRPIATKVNDASIATPALMMLAKLDAEAGDVPSAESLLKRAAYDFPGSPDQPAAAIAYARLLEQQNKFTEAAAVYEEVRTKAPAEQRAPALVGLGRGAERSGNQLDARTFYAEALRDATWDSDDWNEAIDALGKVNTALIFTPGLTPESKTYTVEKGDNFTAIGIKLNTTQGLLTRANGLGQDATLHVGQTLKVTPKDFRIIIERSKCRMYLLDNNGIFKRYVVGLGKPGHETTLGNYKIGNKEKDPTWHKPGVGPIPPGDPANELGTRWMPFVPVQEGLPSDLGIHGTLDPATIGKYSSMGCARMHKEDVEELYDLIVRSTPVHVVETVDADMLAGNVSADA